MTSSVMEAAASASSSPNDPPPPSAWSSAPREPILPSLRGAIFRRSEELERSNLSSRVCVVLHGHGMTAKDMEDWADHLGLFQEDMHYVFLQAPSQWYAPASRFLPSWFTYTKEHEGVAEDEICKTAADAMLSGVAVSVKMALQHLDCKADLAETVCAGFSEGGCVALELASFVPFKAVFTLVSHRRSERARAPCFVHGTLLLPRAIPFTTPLGRCSIWVPRDTGRLLTTNTTCIPATSRCEGFYSNASEMRRRKTLRRLDEQLNRHTRKCKSHACSQHGPNRRVLPLARHPPKLEHTLLRQQQE